MLIKPLAALVAASVMLLPMAASAAAESKKADPAKSVKSTAKASAKSTAKVAVAPVLPDVELEHGLDETTAQALQALVDEFNASGAAKQKIVLSTRKPDDAVDGGKPPAMVVLDDETRQRFLDGKPRYTPLYQVMASAKEKFPSLPIPAPMPPYLNGDKGRLNALPIGLTTPVMFYNKAASPWLNFNKTKPLHKAR